jgi:cobalamin biosynthesis Co2+ chelatase CbiK
MPTIKQRQAFIKIAKNFELKNPEPAGKLLREAGYKKISLQPSRILDSKGFQELLAKIDDSQIVAKWYKWALSDKMDKRVSLEAGEKIMRLKNRYPKEQIDLDLRLKRENLIEA